MREPATKKKTTKKNTPAKRTPKPKPVVRSADSEAAAELSAQLSKLRRRKSDTTQTGKKKSIAQRTAAFRTGGKQALCSWGGILLCLLGAGFFKFCLVGYSFSALVCLCLAGILLFYTLMPPLTLKYPKFGKGLTRLFTVLLCAGLLVVGITEAVIIKASFGDPQAQCDYLLVLGAGVHGSQPSLSLQNRIDAAYDYLTAHPDVTAVLSGGQGEGEDITEAKCMFDHLTQRGIDPSRLWLEEQAASTWENLNFSLDLIQEKTGSRPERIGVLSSEYHLFRASLFTRACGAEFIGVPAKTTKVSLRINYFMREVAGVWHYLILGGRYQ